MRSVKAAAVDTGIKAAGKPLDGRKLRVAVIGGGPAGACAAETLAKGGCETFLIERKMDNCKPCGGAIPLCMVGEFDLPEEIIDRKVTKMKMISPSNRAVDVGQTLNDKEYIGMCRREVMDDFLRKRAKSLGTNLVNGLFMKLDDPGQGNGPMTIHYNDYEVDAKVGEPKTMEVDVIIGADGANSRVAKNIDAGEYDYAIAFQERIKIPDEKMEYYKDLAEMYVGDDVSPDFYGWVFPKYDHVAVGTGTVVNKTSIKQYQAAMRKRAEEKCAGGKIIRVEAHPIPEHPRPRRVQGRVTLVGDAAGYVTNRVGPGVPRPDEIRYLFDIGRPLGDIGEWGLIACCLAVTADQVVRHRLWGAPAAAMVLGAWFVRGDHIFTPIGVVGMAIIGVVSAYLAWHDPRIFASRTMDPDSERELVGARQ